MVSAMSNNPDPGLLTEDVNTLEVVQNGQQKLVRVLDREQAAKSLREQAAKSLRESTSPEAPKPIHEG
jgi:hypothetical protein